MNSRNTKTLCPDSRQIQLFPKWKQLPLTLRHTGHRTIHLDAIIAVGYRVYSLKATRFRQWATKILNEYIRKGFAMDDERLKQGPALFGKDYFRELLAANSNMSKLCPQLSRQ